MLTCLNLFQKNVNILKLLILKVGKFPHRYHMGGDYCPFSGCREVKFAMQTDNSICGMDFNKQRCRKVKFVMQTDNSICGMDFNKQGNYLVSCTKTGCVTAHIFEVLHTLTRRYP
ncbi:hypothetical protein V8G54_025631, partial [Vigna mungo]